jgi:nuclear transport factor 2 (NTF2) superfamily protein
MLKYELTELSEFLTKERKKVEGLRDELIKKYGEEDGKGGIMVKMIDETKDDDGNVISSKFNENYLKFDEEYSTLLNNEKEIEYPEITKSDLKEAGKSNDDYRVLFKLIKKEPK